MSDRIEQLAAGWRDEERFPEDTTEEVFEVSAATAKAGVIYEKLRTSIDYQEEHLLRRNAILRIIKRFLGSDVPVDAIARELLKELIWAGHLPNNRVPKRFAKELTPIIEKYEPLMRAVDDMSEEREFSFAWVLDVLATELEYAISPPYNQESLVSYMYEEMRGRVEWDENIIISDEDKDMKLYVAIHKSLLKSNRATLRFRVLTLYYPDWPGASTDRRVKELADNLETVIDSIEGQISHPLTEKLILILRRRAGMFRVIGDAIDVDPDEVSTLLADPSYFDRTVARELKKRTKSFRTRLRRTVLRTVLFLFLTKMLLALVMEVPYDLLVFGELHVSSLAVNILFHPLFLAFIALTVSIPERKNASDYKDVSRALRVGADHPLLNVRVKPELFGTWGKIFSAAYALTFLFTYGMIAAVLASFHFSWLSISLFLFFISLVTFFGIRIRTSTRDVILSGKRSGILGSIFDVFVLPIVRAGRWLSLKVAKINVFIYFFDFMLEAPFKVAIQFLENWLLFIREKKEEL